MPIQCCRQSISARRGKRYAELGLLHTTTSRAISGRPYPGRSDVARLGARPVPLDQFLRLLAVVMVHGLEVDDAHKRLHPGTQPRMYVWFNQLAIVTTCVHLCVVS